MGMDTGMVGVIMGVVVTIMDGGEVGAITTAGGAVVIVAKLQSREPKDAR